MNDNRYTVLIADRDIDSTRNLKERFLKEDFRVFSVDSAQKALECVRKWKIDFTVIDNNLKDIEGYKIVPLMKDIRPDIKVIISTLQNSHELEGKSRATGILYYAIKPLDYDVIIDVVKYAYSRTSIKNEKK